MRTRSNAAEGGQVLPLVALALLIAAGALVVLAHLGRVASERAHAQTAADAAALAGVLEGRAAAEELAEANGAELVSFAVDGRDVQVVVEREGVRATARARRDDP